MSRSSLRVAVSSLSLVWAFVACGGRSDVPGSGYDEPNPLLAGAAGSTPGKAGSSATAGTGGGSAGVGAAGAGGVGASGGVGPGGAGGFGAGGGGPGGAPGSCSSCFSTTGAAQCPSTVQACKSSTTCAQFDACVKQKGCLELGFGGFTKCIAQCGPTSSQKLWLNFASCQLCDSSCAFGACPGASGEVCGSGGAGGGPQGCVEGAKCNGNDSCGSIDPSNPNCTTSCTCFNGTYQCSTSCGPDDCNSCVASSAKAVCPKEAQQCAQFPGCMGLFECMTKAGCHASPNPIACASQSGCTLPAGPATKVAADLGECSKCNGCGQCPINPGECGSGGGGSGGFGGNPGKTCGDCSLGAIQTGKCPKEVSLCEKTPGCLSVAQCAKTSGCMETANPVTCAQQSCKGSAEAFELFGQLFQCVGCGACQPQCLACGGGGGGGTGGGPQQSCDECVEENQFKCQADINACFADPECSKFLDCMQNEDPDKCQQKFPGGVPGYMKIIDCLVCTACGDACSNEVPPDFCASDL